MILTNFAGRRDRVLQQVTDLVWEALEEVEGVGTILFQATETLGGEVRPLSAKDAYLVEIGIGGDLELDRIAWKSAQGLIWAILCHELGHIRHWKADGLPNPISHFIPSLTLALEYEAWRRAECDILPQLPEHMLREVLKVWDDLKAYGLISYQEAVRQASLI